MIGTGTRILSQKRPTTVTDLYNIASEHHVLYQYNIANAANHYIVSQAQPCNIVLSAELYLGSCANRDCLLPADTKGPYALHR